jgi:tetratricopeptide (TPR) repeat protein
MMHQRTVTPTALMAIVSRATLASALAVLVATPVVAQGRSGLYGTAVDEQGKPVADLELVVRPEGEGREQTIKADRRGRFSARFLASGSYVIDVQDTDRYFIKSAQVDVRDPSGMKLMEYEVAAHPDEGLGAFPIQGGNATTLDLVIAPAGYRDALCRDLAGGALRGELEELVRLFAADQIEEVVAVGTRLMETGSELSDLQHILGLAYARLGRWDESEPLLRRATELAPEQPDLKVSLGTMLLEKARAQEDRQEDARAAYAEAEDWLARAAAEMDPPPVPLLINHSIALEGLGREAEAVTVLERAAREDPDNVMVRFRLAALLRAAGQPERAMEVIAELPDDPRAADSLYNVAVTYYNSQDYDSALVALKRAEEANPNHALAHRLLGRVYYLKEEYAKAIPHLRRFVELEPDHPEAEMERDLVRYLEQEVGGRS